MLCIFTWTFNWSGVDYVHLLSIRSMNDVITTNWITAAHNSTTESKYESFWSQHLVGFCERTHFLLFLLDIFVLDYLIIMKYHELRNSFVFGIFTVSGYVCLCALTQPNFSTFHFWEKAVAHGSKSYFIACIGLTKQHVFKGIFLFSPSYLLHS